MISIRIYGEDQLREVSRALRRAPGHLRRDLTRGLRDAAEPAVRDLRRETRSADVSGRRVGGRRPFTAPTRPKALRGPMARAIESDISTGGGDPRVRIWLREGSIPPRIRRLVKFVLGDAQRWRHPIMGHRRGRWASQHAPNVWWRTLRGHMPRFRREVDHAVEQTAQRIEGSG